MEAYRHDVEIPRRYGVDQTVGDTLGPGGVFRFLRTAPVMREIVADLRELSPDALLINYANPMAMICWYLDRLGQKLSVSATASKTLPADGATGRRSLR